MKDATLSVLIVVVILVVSGLVFWLGIYTVRLEDRLCAAERQVRAVEAQRDDALEIAQRYVAAERRRGIIDLSVLGRVQGDKRKD